ncbi:hypothetical protein TVAG_150920 [Trichomonas vaginalis G3]|uniref:RING-type domain-containing protein n=1 Tax=Trichomonas vaginalis (strain ATCC PRA-98 / G3) TaxID=412133 RepID=A2FM04_TRIV3|nr:RING/U-box family [Trichomonas vaginalis G3]EAX94045.1 hypothetical protein TVAG_150920 [Trichomonas vaginalis G3]KAI5548225.1 RING/U-box family [Trichomonas vaginalis G3]|eukprot:XP_001306975.1 hypothetical protein [Trichomonas vaginalis G3]
MHETTPSHGKKRGKSTEADNASPIRSLRFSMENPEELTPSKVVSNIYKSPARETWAKSKRDEIDDFISYAVENLTTSDLRYLNSKLESEGLVKNASGNTQVFKCAICLNNVNDFTISTCGHVFCRKCIEKWLESSNTCPKCHCSITANDIIVPKVSDPDIEDESQPVLVSVSNNAIIANKSLLYVIVFVVLLLFFIPFT